MIPRRAMISVYMLTFTSSIKSAVISKINKGILMSASSTGKLSRLCNIFLVPRAADETFSTLMALCVEIIILLLQQLRYHQRLCLMILWRLSWLACSMWIRSDEILKITESTISSEDTTKMSSETITKVAHQAKLEIPQNCWKFNWTPAPTQDVSF